ncbi:50S ribosomal protein L34, chloroplastic [Carica papaya]|uniref:50S ribosomal protein L34, chloroplastic n=1 Tax=Carica papaya TaxID=3649 RepID=UPI000B8CEA07|nr:50S ribosomal protein L34, chloroplastic [Carica papaya]
MASVSLAASTASTPWLTNRGFTSRIPSASLSILTGSRRRSSSSLNVAVGVNATRFGLLHCSFVPSSLSLAFPSSFSGLSLGLGLNCNIGVKEARRGLVVRAGKAALCQTKRNRSRKSLARTHGFRRRMRTTSGRAVLKRRRAKGRWVLCPKSNPNSGKRA